MSRMSELDTEINLALDELATRLVTIFKEKSFTSEEAVRICERIDFEDEVSDRVYSLMRS